MVPVGVLSASYAVSLESWEPFERIAADVHQLLEVTWR